MRVSWSIAALFVIAAPAAAELNTYYEGMQRVSDKEVPTKGEFCVDKGHAVMRLEGSRALRMIYSAKENDLRLVDDSDKKYFDVSGAGLAGDMTAEMEKQIAKLPAAQQEQARAMLKSTMSMVHTDPPRYVGTDAKQTILGHECTRVDVFRGDRRTAEYWASTSKDFVMTAEERANCVAMNRILGNLGITATNVGGEGTRAFAWDTATDGYPLISRCLEDSTVTLELRMVAFDHKALSKDLWKIPSGYHEEKMSGR